MGVTLSKLKITDCYNIVETDKITVNFIQLKKKNYCNVSPEQLNMLLGLSVPKFSILEKSNYPYLFCVDSIVDIDKIATEYGYEIGFTTKIKVLKNNFNEYHKATCYYFDGGCYELVRI